MLNSALNINFAVKFKSITFYFREMKRLLFLGTILTILGADANAQAVTDTVSVGAGYVNQNYYQLSSGTKTTASKAEWDIAFQTSGDMSYAIAANTYSGAVVYHYPNGSVNNWGDATDTAGLITWPKLYNAETTWNTGAFNQGADASNPFDLGWGIYDISTHFITGDSLYIVKLTDGNFKKLWIKNLANGVYNFIYANLDGTNPDTVALSKATYATKNFGYYSLVNNAAVDHEPVASTAWDLVFTQYTSDLTAGASPTPYMGTATGVLQNAGVLVAKAADVANTATYADYATQTYKEEINTIGWDWKVYANSVYTVEDSTVYFVQAQDSAIWKIVFKGFGGSTTGDFIFTKEKLKSAPVPPTPSAINNINNVATLSIYPNPVVAGGNLNVVVDLFQSNTNVNVTMYDISGKQVFNTNVNNQKGLKAIAVPTAGLRAGLYIVSLDVNGSKAVQKVSIQ